MNNTGGWLLALVGLGAVGYLLTSDYRETEPMESRRGSRRADGSRLFGMNAERIMTLEGVYCPPFSMDQASRAFRRVRVPRGVSTATLREGMNVEREHANIGSCHSPTLAAKIAAAHLRESAKKKSSSKGCVQSCASVYRRVQGGLR